MNKKIYYFDSKKTEPIEVSWGYNWNSFTVTKDGEVICFLSTKWDLKNGEYVKLADGRNFFIQLSSDENLIMTINDKAVIGSAGDPFVQLQRLANLLLILGAVNFFCGLVSEFTSFGFFRWIGIIGLPNILIGICYGLTAYWVYFKKSVFSLYLALAMSCLDIGVWGYTILFIRGKLIIWEFIFRLIIVSSIWRGFSLLKVLKFNAEEEAIEEIGK